MHVASLLFALALLIPASAAAPAFTCRHGILPRKEWRTLTTTERSNFLKALKSTMVRSSKSKPSFYDNLVKTHLDFKDAIHGFASFFPWHRYYLAVLEQELQKQGAITLPYWAWDHDSQAPELAPVWGDDALSFGRNGDSSTFCVTTGAFANQQVFHPNSRCLRREWGMRDQLDAFVDTEVITSYISNDKRFITFSEHIEQDPHGGVHVNIGGDSGDMSRMHSPNDPIFYLHHANVDRFWWKWQQAHPELAKTYNGQFFDRSTRRTRNAQPTDALEPYPAKVADVFDTRDLCYTYVETDLSKFKPSLPQPIVREFGLGQDTEAALGDFVEHTGLPKDPLVRVIPLPEESVVVNQMPESSDRTDLLKLRVPKPLPDSWIEMSNADKAKVRANEAEIREMIKQLNNDPGFVSSSALWNREDMLTKLVAPENASSPATAATSFKAVLADGLKVTVKKESNKSPEQTVANLKQRFAIVAELVGSPFERPVEQPVARPVEQ